MGEANGEVLGAGLKCRPWAGGWGRGAGRGTGSGRSCQRISTADSSRAARPEPFLQPESFRSTFLVWGERNVFSVSGRGRVPLGLRRWARQLHTVEDLGLKGHERRDAARGRSYQVLGSWEESLESLVGGGRGPAGYGHPGLEAKGVQRKWHSSWQ